MNKTTASRIVLSSMLTLAIVIVVSEGLLNDFHHFVISKITKGESTASPNPSASGQSGIPQSGGSTPGAGNGQGGGGGKSW